MRIAVEKLFMVANIDEYQFRFDKSDASTNQGMNVSSSGRIEDTDVLTADFLKLAHDKGVRIVSIIVPKDQLIPLRKTYPDVFPAPHYSMQLKDIRAEYESILMMNQLSERARKLYLWEDVTSYDPRRDATAILAASGSEITTTLLNGLSRTQVARENPFIDIRSSEYGALVFVPGAKNIAMKIDVFATLAENDFDIEEISTSVEDAFRFYREKQPKLVVLGKLNAEVETKELYLCIDAYDPFAKIINYDESPSMNRVAEGKRIRTVYDRPYVTLLREYEVEEERAKVMQKKALTEEQKKYFMLRIKKIQDTCSAEEYINTRYLMKQLGKTVDMHGVEIMLKKSKKFVPKTLLPD